MPSSNPPSLAAQLRDAWASSGLTLQEVVDRGDLGFGADSLSRKLAGKQVLYADEARAIAIALKLKLELAPARRRRAA